MKFLKACLLALFPLSAHAQQPLVTGSTPSGYDFSLYEDGSGSVQTPGGEWQIDCRVDAMSDARNCSLLGGEYYSVFVDFGETQTVERICAMGHDFPGRQAAIRFGQGKPIETDADGCIAGSYINEMKAAPYVRTRTVKWPYDVNVDHQSSLEGFPDALDLIGKIREKLPK